MPEIFTYGRFEVEPQNEEAFFDAWSKFAAWASARPGAGTLRLARDVRNAGRFISLGRMGRPRCGPGVEELGRVQGAAGQAREARRRSSSRRSSSRCGRPRAANVDTLSPPADVQPIHAPT